MKIKVTPASLARSVPSRKRKETKRKKRRKEGKDKKKERKKERKKGLVLHVLYPLTTTPQT